MVFHSDRPGDGGFYETLECPPSQVPPPKTWVVKWSPADSNAPMIIHGDFFVSFGCVNAFLQASSLQFGSLWNEIVASYLCCSLCCPKCWAGGVQNAFEQVTKITQLQSEAGAAGAMQVWWTQDSPIYCEVLLSLPYLPYLLPLLPQYFFSLVSSMMSPHLRLHRTDRRGHPGRTHQRCSTDRMLTCFFLACEFGCLTSMA